VRWYYEAARPRLVARQEAYRLRKAFYIPGNSQDPPSELFFQYDQPDGPATPSSVRGMLPCLSTVRPLPPNHGQPCGPGTLGGTAVTQPDPHRPASVGTITPPIPRPYTTRSSAIVLPSRGRPVPVDLFPTLKRRSSKPKPVEQTLYTWDVLPINDRSSNPKPVYTWDALPINSIRRPDPPTWDALTNPFAPLPDVLDASQNDSVSEFARLSVLARVASISSPIIIKDELGSDADCPASTEAAS
jgi:hypothetical protein